MDPAATMLDVLQQTRFRVLFQSMNLRKPSLLDVAQHCAVSAQHVCIGSMVFPMRVELI